jgi:hypothetical protein
MILVAASLRGTAFAQSANLEVQAKAVVKLRIHRALQSTEETAAGVFVGKDRQTAYFITACHAVIQDDVRVRSVMLRFHDSPHDFNAAVFDHYDPILDLAVVTIPVVDLPTDMREMVRRDAVLGMPIHVIGHPIAGDWSVAAGTVQNLNTAMGDIHHFTTSRDVSLAEGHSGGPVFDQLGDFVGMHTASGPTYGIEAKSAEILTQLNAWHVPTNNVTIAHDTGPSVAETGLKDQDLINSVIDSYVAAYNQSSALLLWQIWPDSSLQARQAIEAYFRGARSITMRVTNRKIEIKDARATVMARSSQDFVPKNGSPQRSPDGPITFDLAKTNSRSWIITQVR